MTVKARCIAACGFLLIVLAVAGPAAPSFAQTPATTATSIKDQLVGAWQLVSISLDNTQPYGGSPQGAMSFDASGHFSVIVLSAGQAKNISYYGTYTVNDADSSMTIHIAGSTLSHENGHDLKRKLVLAGDELVVQSPNGKIQLTWKRAS
jgi:hypothetical protein